MSGLVNKIKDALHSDKPSQPEGTSGPHTSRAANAADPRVDSDRDHRANPATGTHGTTGVTGTHGTHTAGTTGLGGTHGSTAAGPHSSNLANKADPRVDSDRDGRGIGQGVPGTTATGNTHGTTGLHSTGATGTHGSSGLTGTHSTTGAGYGTTGSTTAGPHSSNMANKLDPRVDSDRDGKGIGQGPAGTSATGSSAHTGTHGTSGLTGTHGTHGTSGLTGTTGAGYGSTASGPHSSNLANKADPRVDSDRDGRGIGQGYPGTTSTGTTHTGTHGTSGLTGTHGTHTGTHGTSGLTGTHGNTGYGSTTAGPHSSNLANKADPRVDSDRDGKGIGQGPAGTTATGSHNTHSGTHGTSGLTGTHGTHATTGPNATGAHTAHGGVGGVHGSGPGPAPNTAGPHKSDMLNKVDPRVDSDLDGSKTVGGNKTYQAGTTTTGYNKDPTDAAQVPPSVLQKTLGAPVIEHDDHGHDRARRNSTQTHQETYRGV